MEIIVPKPRNPRARVKEVSLLLLCWFTLSPLMLRVRPTQVTLKERTLYLLILFSPFTGFILSLLFLLFGVPLLSDRISDLGAFPEFTGSLDSTERLWQLLLNAYFLPVYSICVLFLFFVMWVTGYSYVQASVGVCELMAPLVCVVISLGIIVLTIVKMCNMTLKGVLISFIPLLLQGGMIYVTMVWTLAKIIMWGDATSQQIFDLTVKMLVELGKETHTNYITANMIVYILPLFLILLVGYAGWVIYTLNKCPDLGESTSI